MHANVMDGIRRIRGYEWIEKGGSVRQAIEQVGCVLSSAVRSLGDFAMEEKNQRFQFASWRARKASHP
jgi:hypothetical protein